VGDQRQAPAALARERDLCTGGLVGPRAGLDRCGKSHPYRDRSSDRPLMQGSYQVIMGCKTTEYGAAKGKQEMRCKLGWKTPKDDS